MKFKNHKINWLLRQTKRSLVWIALLLILSWLFIVFENKPRIGAIPMLEILDFETRDNIVFYAFRDQELFNRDIVSENMEIVKKTSKENVYRIYPTKQFHKLGDKWFQINYASTTRDKFIPPISLISKARAATIFPTYDTELARISNAETWANKRGGIGTTVTNTGATADAAIEADATSGWDELRVLGFDFDVSSVVGTVSSATLNTKPNNCVENQDTNMVLSAAVLSAPPVAGDYEARVGNFAERSARRNMSDCVVDTYLVFTLNNFTEISDGGTAEYIVTGHFDFDNTEPTFVAGQRPYLLTIYMSETAGTASDPYLEVTTAVAGENEIMIIGWIKNLIPKAFAKYELD